MCGSKRESVICSIKNLSCRLSTAVVTDRQRVPNGVRSPQSSMLRRALKAAEGLPGPPAAAMPAGAGAMPDALLKVKPASDQNGVAGASPGLSQPIPAACTRPRSRLGKAKNVRKLPGATADDGAQTPGNAVHVSKLSFNVNRP